MPTFNTSILLLQKNFENSQSANTNSKGFRSTKLNQTKIWYSAFNRYTTQVLNLKEVLHTFTKPDLSLKYVISFNNEVRQGVTFIPLM